MIFVQTQNYVDISRNIACLKLKVIVNLYKKIRYYKRVYEKYMFFFLYTVDACVPICLYFIF